MKRLYIYAKLHIWCEEVPGGDYRVVRDYVEIAHGVLRDCMHGEIKQNCSLELERRAYIFLHIYLQSFLYSYLNDERNSSTLAHACVTFSSIY